MNVSNTKSKNLVLAFPLKENLKKIKNWFGADEQFFSIDLNSWSELSCSLMADRKLVQKIQDPHATAKRSVAVVLI